MSCASSPARRWAKRPGLTAAAVAAVMLGTFALAQPINHDESQYVAAAALTASGLIPYRDFAYFQTPLQPFALAPLVLAGGTWAWPALRLANAALGLVTLVGVYAAARRIGAATDAALIATALMATCDIFLFGAGTARNDALPAACLALALWVTTRGADQAMSPRAAALLGALLTAAVAAKLSYLVPAAAGVAVVLVRWPHRVGWIVAGSAPLAAGTALVWALAPEAFTFEVVRFPIAAPAEFYADHPWKLSWAAKAIDVVKFLAMGPALCGMMLVAARLARGRRWCWLDAMIVAGAIAALAPWPTWRQYLLPMLPPLFVRLAGLWAERTPDRRWRVAAGLSAAVGIAPSLLATAGGFAVITSVREGERLRQALDARGLSGPVMTLAPEYLPAAARLLDQRFAAGPFYFRSRGLLDAGAERRLHLISHVRMPSVPLRATTTVIDVATRDEDGYGAGMDHWLCRLAVGRRIPVAGTRFTLVAVSAFREPPNGTAGGDGGC